jgi:hypothetical protein
MAIELTRNAYSPRLLAEELNLIVKPDFIRKQVAKGLLPAKRFGGKNIIILRADAEEWLASLPSATAPTNLGGGKGEGDRKKRVKTVSEIAFEYRRRQELAEARRARQK